MHHLPVCLLSLFLISTLENHGGCFGIVLKCSSEEVIMLHLTSAAHSFDCFGEVGGWGWGVNHTIICVLGQDIFYLNEPF